MHALELARHRRETIGEQCYGPWSPAEYRKDAFAELREELADGLNYLEVIEVKHAHTERAAASVHKIQALLIEAYTRLGLFETSVREENHGSTQHEEEAEG